MRIRVILPTAVATALVQQPQNFVDLKTVGADQIKGDHLDWVMSQSTAEDGEILGVPTDVGGMAMAYRTDLFAGAGLPTDREKVGSLWPTWDAFIDTGTGQIFWGIVFPIVRPAAFVLGLFGFVTAWNDFLWPFIVLKSPERYTAQIAIKALQNSYDVDLGLAMSGSFLATIPLVVLFAFVGRRMVAGILDGAFKRADASATHLEELHDLRDRNDHRNPGDTAGKSVAGQGTPTP